jgi:hypothetical protein
MTWYLACYYASILPIAIRYINFLQFCKVFKRSTGESAVLDSLGDIMSSRHVELLSHDSFFHCGVASLGYQFSVEDYVQLAQTLWVTYGSCDPFHTLQSWYRCLCGSGSLSLWFSKLDVYIVKVEDLASTFHWSREQP